MQRVGARFGVTAIAVLLQGYLASHATSSALLADAFHATFWRVFAFSTVPFVLAFFLPSARPSLSRTRKGGFLRSAQQEVADEFDRLFER